MCWLRRRLRCCRRPRWAVGGRRCRSLCRARQRHEDVERRCERSERSRDVWHGGGHSMRERHERADFDLAAYANGDEPICCRLDPIDVHDPIFLRNAALVGGVGVAVRNHHERRRATICVSTVAELLRILSAGVATLCVRVRTRLAVLLACLRFARKVLEIGHDENAIRRFGETHAAARCVTVFFVHGRRSAHRREALLREDVLKARSRGPHRPECPGRRNSVTRAAREKTTILFGGDAGVATCDRVVARRAAGVLREYGVADRRRFLRNRCCCCRRSRFLQLLQLATAIFDRLHKRITADRGCWYDAGTSNSSDDAGTGLLERWVVGALRCADEGRGRHRSCARTGCTRTIAAQDV